MLLSSRTAKLLRRWFSASSPSSLFFGTFAWIGIICGIVGLVLGSMARKENPCGMATAGFVLSLIAVILCAITFIACLACASAFNSALSSM